MRKGTRIVKKITALFLVLLLSIDSLAAVVSDNDGSAFITKAEFDSLTNDFQSQLDQYNTSIDNKIEAAIASYLAGISVSKEKELNSFFKTIVEKDSNSKTWTDLSNIKPSTNNEKAARGRFFVRLSHGIGGAVNNTGNYTWLINGYSYGHAQPQWVENGHSSRILFFDEWEKNGDTYYCLNNTNRWSSRMDFTAQGAATSNATVSKTPAQSKPPTTYTMDYTAYDYPTIILSAFTITSTGWGCDVDITNGVSYSVVDNYDVLKYNSATSMASYTIYGIVFKNRYTFSTATADLISENIRGTNGGYMVYRSNTADTDTDAYVTYCNFIYKSGTPRIITNNMNTLINNAASEVLGNPVYKYEGIPICQPDENGKLKLKFKVTTSTGDYRIYIANGPFGNSSTVSVKNTTNKILYNHMGSSGTDEDIVIDIDDDTKDKYLYVKILPSTTGATATLEQTDKIILEISNN